MSVLENDILRLEVVKVLWDVMSGLMRGTVSGRIDLVEIPVERSRSRKEKVGFIVQ